MQNVSQPQKSVLFSKNENDPAPLSATWAAGALWSLGLRFLPSFLSHAVWELSGSRARYPSLQEKAKFGGRRAGPAAPSHR